MKWFSQAKAADHISIIFDVGNASVGGAVVSLDSSGKPTILFTHREQIAIGREIDMKHVLPKMAKVFQSVAAVIHKDGLASVMHAVGTVNIKDVYCILAAPWCISRTKILKIKKDQPFLVTVNLLEDMAENEESLFDKNLAEDSDRVELGKSPLVLVEKKIIKTRLNGYEVRDPFEKKATRVELSLFLSATTSQIQETLDGIVKTVFGHQKVHFNTFNLIAYTALRDVYPTKEDFLFIDVSGELTDIMLVRHHVMLETVSFPFGRNAVVRGVARSLRSEPELVVSDLTLYAQGKAEPKHTSHLKAALADVGAEWLTLFSQAIDNLSKSDFVPTQIFLTTDREVEKVFVDAMSERKVGQFSLEGESFRVTVVNHETLNQFVTVIPGVEADEFIALETLFIRRVALLEVPFFHVGASHLSDIGAGKKVFAL